MLTRNNNKAGQAGFTLIELMIVVVIVAVLAAVALPSYKQYSLGAKRAVGTAELLEVLSLQEQYFLNNKQYATDLTNLNYGANPYFINAGGDEEATATAAIYQIQLATGFTTSAFTLEAVPQQSQTDDSLCGKLTLTHLGVRGSNGTGSTADCW